MSDDAAGSTRAEQGLSGADQQVATFEEGHGGPVRSIQGFLHLYPTIIPFVVLIIGIIVFAIITPTRFFSPLNLSIVLQQVTIVGILAMAQTLIILTAGIDLSVGIIMILGTVVMGRTAVVFGAPLWLAFSLGLFVGFACGAVNGLIVTLLRLPPFIVTLGTLSIFGAINVLYSRSETIRQQEIEAVAPFLQWTGTTIRLWSDLGVELPFLRGWVLTYGSILMVVIALVLSYILTRTAFGRHVYAVGDDPDAARLSGISVTRTLIGVYAFAGFICAVASWVFIGRVGSVSPNAGLTLNLDSITAVVIGGTSLFGGRGSIIGTLLGALIVGVFRNGLALSGLDVVWQDLTVGILIIVAVTIDQWIRRISS